MKLLLKVKNKISLNPFLRKLEPGIWFLFWGLERYRQFSTFKTMPPKLRGSERAILFEELSRVNPINSVLEIGAAYGQNFHLLNEMFPELKITGVDSSYSCVNEGNRLMKEYSIKNSKILYKDARDLSSFSDSSIDVVYSAASLLYIGANDIKKVVKEMARISAKRLVIAELHFPNPYYKYQEYGSLVLRPEGGGSYWVRDYVKLLREILPDSKVELRKVKNALWKAETWDSNGMVISVDKRVKS